MCVVFMYVCTVCMYLFIYVCMNPQALFEATYEVMGDNPLPPELEQDIADDWIKIEVDVCLW